MKTKLPIAMAEPIAVYWRDLLVQNCRRLEVAGSLRRRRPEIGDLELIAIPKNALYEQLDNLLSKRAIRHTDPKRWGLRYRSFIVNISVVNNVNINEDVQIDLFLQPDPATWGINYLLRTGSAEFSRKMVTRRSEGGFMPDHYRVEDARLKVGATVLDTPEEEDVFRLYGIDYVVPAQRVDWYRPKFGPVPDVAWEPEPAQMGLF
jgi:DNA polymerase/3'-5' exonuclease PolX